MITAPIEQANRIEATGITIVPAAAMKLEFRYVFVEGYPSDIYTITRFNCWLPRFFPAGPARLIGYARPCFILQKSGGFSGT